MRPIILVLCFLAAGHSMSAPCLFLSFNVWSTGENQASRGEAAGIFINAHDPDLVALQEMTSAFWSSKLVRWLDKKHDSTSRKLGPNGEDSALALFYRRERFKLVRSGVKWFFPDGDRQKGVVWAELKDRTSGDSLLAFSVQMEEGPDGSDEIRMSQVKMLLAELGAVAQKQEDLALVGGGDFGAPSSAASLRWLQQCGWRDAQLATIPCADSRHTWHDAPLKLPTSGYRGISAEKAKLRGRFDHFFYDPERVSPYGFLMDCGQGVLDISDHVLVMFDFQTHSRTSWKDPGKAIAMTPTKPSDEERTSWNRMFLTNRLDLANEPAVLVLGGRTEHALWQIEHTQLPSSATGTVVVAVGGGNIASRTADKETAIDVMLGVRAVVEAVLERLPRAKIILVPILPDEAGTDSRIAVINREIVKLADGRQVFWRDRSDSARPPVWEPSVPRACRPISRFDTTGSHGKWWWANRLAERRNQVACSDGVYDVVMIGDSITHFWEDYPHVYCGRDVYETLTDKYDILNLGYGGDRTENVLWRCENGELDGYRAKCIMLMIGTNNGGDTPCDTAKGIRRILELIDRKQPHAKVLLISLLPRGNPDDKNRLRITSINNMIKNFADGNKVIWIDFTDRLLRSDGTFSPGMMSEDLLHLHHVGYETWRDAVSMKLKEIIGK